jgi:hypothetical protein
MIRYLLCPPNITPEELFLCWRVKLELAGVLLFKEIITMSWDGII